MISQFFILSSRGDTLCFKEFKSDLHRNTPQVLFNHVQLGGSETKPVFIKDGVNYFWIKRENLLIVATIRKNVSPFIIFESLEKVYTLVKDFCGVFSEQAIRHNFFLVYEVVDEIMDAGIPECKRAEDVSYNIMLNLDKRPDF